MKASWSSLQVIDKKELVSLAKDLLAPSWILQDKQLDTMDGTIGTIFNSTTPTTITIDTLVSTLTNQEKDWQVL